MRLRHIICGVLLLASQAATSVSASTFNGEFWDANVAISNLTVANSIIAGSGPTSTFQSTAIDYPNGSSGSISAATTIASFLGADAGSISGSTTATLTRSVFRFTGFIDLLSGVTNFAVGSDDGFRLTVGGNVVSSFAGLRAFGTTSVNVATVAGRTAFELIYFENTGLTGVEFRVNNALAVPSAVPLPAGLPLLLAGLGGLAIVKRRKLA